MGQRLTRGPGLRAPFWFAEPTSSGLLRRRRSGVRLGGFLFSRLDRQMMPDRAAGDRAQDRMMMRKMAGDGAHGSAFETSGLCRRHRRGRKQKASNASGGESLHVILASMHSAET